MSYKLYDYVDSHGVNDFKAWSETLQKVQRAKLNVRLDMLEQKGLGLLPNILAGTDTPGIQKLKIKGKIQLRPMLCRGPTDPGTEFTLLFGAIEKGDKLIPRKADEIADERRKEVVTNPERRKEHERVN